MNIDEETPVKLQSNAASPDRDAAHCNNISPSKRLIYCYLVHFEAFSTQLPVLLSK